LVIPPSNPIGLGAAKICRIQSNRLEFIGVCHGFECSFVIQFSQGFKGISPRILINRTGDRLPVKSIAGLQKGSRLQRKPCSRFRRGFQGRFAETGNYLYTYVESWFTYFIGAIMRLLSNPFHPVLPSRQPWLTSCVAALILAVYPLAGTGWSQTVTETADPIAQSANSQEAEPKKETTRERLRRNAGESTRKLDSGGFLRIRVDDKGKPAAFETSITRYEKLNQQGDRITVDLIGVVHIGEAAYYQQLNEIFTRYEALLYELVAPEGTRIPKGGDRGNAGMNPIAGLQMGMQSVLGLEFQLEQIDYTKDNFVHADMSPEEFAASMQDNDESIGGYALRAIGQSMAMQASGKGDSGMGMLMAMMSSNKEIKMRRSFAKQMLDMEMGMVMFEGKDGSTIIDHRNRKCMDVLQREIQNGKRNIAIFYGAGHLPDMERRLIEDFGMKRGGRNWLTAWSLKMPAKE
jgi:hypothetical protein